MKANTDHETRFHLVNSQACALRFVLEPWGREYVLRPQDEFLLVFKGPEEVSEPEVILSDGRIEVWGPAANVDVFKNGQELTEYIYEEMPVTRETAS